MGFECWGGQIGTERRLIFAEPLHVGLTVPDDETLDTFGMSGCQVKANWTTLVVQVQGVILWPGCVDPLGHDSGDLLERTRVQPTIDLPLHDPKSMERLRPMASGTVPAT